MFLAVESLVKVGAWDRRCYDCTGAARDCCVNTTLGQDDCDDLFDATEALILRVFEDVAEILPHDNHVIVLVVVEKTKGRTQFCSAETVDVVAAVIGAPVEEQVYRVRVTGKGPVTRVNNSRCHVRAAVEVGQIVAHGHAMLGTLPIKDAQTNLGGLELRSEPWEERIFVYVALADDSFFFQRESRLDEVAGSTIGQVAIGPVRARLGKVAVGVCDVFPLEACLMDKGYLWLAALIGWISAVGEHEVLGDHVDALGL